MFLMAEKSQIWSITQRDFCRLSVSVFLFQIVIIFNFSPVCWQFYFFPFFGPVWISFWTVTNTTRNSYEMDHLTRCGGTLKDRKQ